MSALWLAVLLASAGCYLLKLGGVSLPRDVLARAAVQRTASFLPVAMLSALVTVQLISHGRSYAVDWPVMAGTAAAVIALLLRRGLFVVFLVAIAVTALLRHL